MTGGESTAGAVQSPLRWELASGGGVTTVRFAGEVDENVDFDQLRARLTSPVRFDLGGVRRINSCGVREWVNFVRALDAGAFEVAWVDCSLAMVNQLNIISNFAGRARVVSFRAPYLCTGCNREEELVLEVERHFPRGPGAPPLLPCPGCRAPMQLDDLPERYLAFLEP